MGDIETFEAVSELPQLDDSAGVDSKLSKPNDVKVDSGGNVLVMDTGHERIAVFRNGKFVTGVMPGFFKNGGNTYSNIGCNDLTGAVAATNDDGHCITVLAPPFVAS